MSTNGIDARGMSKRKGYTYTSQPPEQRDKAHQEWWDALPPKEQARLTREERERTDRAVADLAKRETSGSNGSATPSRPPKPQLATVDGEPIGNSAEWPEPVPLPTSLLPVPVFDYALLPVNLRPWVEDVSERMQCPPEFVAVPVMAALGSVIGRQLALRPKLLDDWTAIPNLWGLCIGPPGVMKSPAQNQAMAPLKMLGDEARRFYEAEKLSYQVKEAEAKARAEANKAEAKKKLTKNKSADVKDLLKRESIGDEPTLRRYITSNASAEALGLLMQQNPNGLLLERDEALSLIDHLDEEGHAAERGLYLTAWDGHSSYTFDRIGRGLDLHIPALCLSLIGGTQPARIAHYLEGLRRGDCGNDGLIQRFGLMVWPDVPKSWEHIDTRPNADAREMAYRIFQRLDVIDPDRVGASRESGSIPFLRLTERAYEHFTAWRTRLERRLRDGELDPMVESHLAKYRKTIPALALISHLADNGTGDVNEAAVGRAIKWADYLERHAARTYASGTVATADAARAILDRVRSGHLNKQFSSRDVWRPGWSRLRDRDAVQEALRMLADYDWLGIVKQETKGRTATVYEVNPNGVQRENVP